MTGRKYESTITESVKRIERLDCLPLSLNCLALFSLEYEEINISGWTGSAGTDGPSSSISQVECTLSLENSKFKDLDNCPSPSKRKNFPPEKTA